MADIPKENNESLFSNTICQNFTHFSESGFKNPSNISDNLDNNNVTEQDLYKEEFNGLGIETGTLDAANKLNKSNDDIIGGLRNVNSTLIKEMRNDTNLNFSIWNIYRVSFKNLI